MTSLKAAGRSRWWHDRQVSLSFGMMADEYERGRPDYPVDAVRWLIGHASSVADVGAGTGKLTGVIRGLGRKVVAVEPDSLMRGQLSRRFPDVEVRDGLAERLPLADGAVSGVTFGQAWHWVDPVLACREADRVLQPYGVLGLIWNATDRKVDWVDQLVRTADAEDSKARVVQEDPPFAPPFTHVENMKWSWARIVTPEQVMSLMVSRSGFIAADAAQQRTIRNAIGTLLSSHPATVGRELIELPYVTSAWRLTRR